MLVGNTCLALGIDAVAACAHLVSVICRHGLTFIIDGKRLYIITEVYRAPAKPGKKVARDLVRWAVPAKE